MLDYHLSVGCTWKNESTAKYIFISFLCLLQTHGPYHKCNQMTKNGWSQ